MTSLLTLYAMGLTVFESSFAPPLFNVLTRKDPVITFR